MRRLTTYVLYSLTILSLPFSSAEGFFCGIQDLELENGYRYDRIDEGIEVLDSAFQTPYSSGQQQFKSLSSYQIGGRGFIEWNNYRIKGSGHYGWILDGTYHRNGNQRGNCKKGRTADGDVGIGYILCVNDCLRVVPLIGYSYDVQRLKIRHVRSSSPLVDPVDIAKGRWMSEWYGPWVGFDLLFNSCLSRRWLSFNAGYEFHYGTGHTKWHQQLVTPVFGIYAYHAKIKNMMGHVFHFDTTYHFCDNWRAGVNLKYTYWGNGHSTKDHFSSTSSIGLTPTQTQSTFQLSWHSFAVMLSVGKAY